MLQVRCSQRSSAAILLSCAMFMGCGSGQQPAPPITAPPATAAVQPIAIEEPPKYKSILDNPVPPPDLGIDQGKWSQLQPRARSFMLDTALRDHGVAVFTSFGVPGVRTVYNRDNPNELLNFSAFAQPNAQELLPLTDAALEELLKHTATLTSIDFTRIEVTEEQGAKFAAFTALEKLSIHMGKTPASLLSSLSAMTKLKSCYFLDTRLDDAGLSSISFAPTLELLDLRNNTGVTDASIPHIAKLTGLKELTIPGTGITMQGLEELQAALPNCDISARPR